MSEPDWAPLTGYRVAVTSARRSDELCALLRRRGATVCAAPAIEMVALPDDEELQRHTEALIAAPPDIVVSTTGIGSPTTPSGDSRRSPERLIACA